MHFLSTFLPTNDPCRLHLISIGSSVCTPILWLLTMFKVSYDCFSSIVSWLMVEDDDKLDCSTHFQRWYKKSFLLPSILSWRVMCCIASEGDGSGVENVTHAGGGVASFFE